MTYWKTAGLLTLVVVQLTGCATSPSDVRAAIQPHVFRTTRSFDVFVGCVADHVVTKFKMSVLPTERGTSFVYDFGTQGFGKGSVMLVDVVRGAPVTAEVYIKGGPWLGRDDLLLRTVQVCADS
jgi:hypothetical protein